MVLKYLKTSLAALVCSVLAASSNKVTLDERNNVDFNGPLYIGSEFRENHVIFDTMSDWTIILDDHANGGSFPSNYDQEKSTTSKKVLAKHQDSDTPSHAQATLDIGSVIFSGPIMKEYMCLQQQRNERSFSSGRLCVTDF